MILKQGALHSVHISLEIITKHIAYNSHFGHCQGSGERWKSCWAQPSGVLMR